MNKKQKVIILLVAIMLSTIIIVPKMIYGYKAIKISKDFINALILNDYENAMALSKGEVKFNINANKDMEFNSEIIKIKAITKEFNRNMAVTNIIAEYIMDNQININAMKLYLIKDDNNYLTYKVYKIDNIDPYNSIIKMPFITSKTKDEIKECFIDYVKGVENKNYEEAGKQLIGQAKTSHNMTKDIIKKANFIIEPNSYEIEYKYGSINNIVTKIDYINDNKNVSVLVSFYKTKKGWKIYDISQN